MAIAEIKGILVSMGALHIADEKGKGNHYTMEFPEGEIEYYGNSVVNLDYDKICDEINVTTFNKFLEKPNRFPLASLCDDLFFELCVSFKTKFKGTFDWFDLSPYRTVPDKFGTPIKKGSVVGFETADGKVIAATVTHIFEENVLQLDKHRLMKRVLIEGTSQYGNRIEKVIEDLMFTPSLPEFINADRVSILY